MVTQISDEAKPGARAAAIKKSITEGGGGLDTERFKFLLETYRETGGLPNIIRRAKLFDRICTSKTIYIDDNPVVGTVGRRSAMLYPYPEYSCRWMLSQSEHFTHLGPIQFSEEDRRLMEEAVAYWRDRCQWSQAQEIYDAAHPGEPSARQLTKTFIMQPTGINPLGAVSLDYPKVLRKGLNGIIAEAEERLSQLPLGNHEAFRKAHFYRAVIISLKAVIKLAQRYASLARAMAQNEVDPERRLELERIAETCQWVPANPAHNFCEAIQSFWFAYVAAQIETETYGISPGRFSEYMYPFYQKDISEGRITREQAIELLEFLFLKHVVIGVHSPAEWFWGNSGETAQHYSMGGLTGDGKDASNEIDFLLIETQRRMMLPQPSLTLFYHDKMPEELLLEAVELIRTGIGQPQFLGTDVMIQRLLYHHGCSVEEARGGCNVACVPAVVSYATSPHHGPSFAMARLIELVLNNGWDPYTKVQVGPETGKAELFTSYGELWEALVKQLQYFVRRQRELTQIELNVMADLLPLPYQSALINDCIERGLEVQEGGAKYTTEHHQNMTTIDLANSLAAIKKLVFEEKRVTMKELKKALEADFEGYEEILQMCLNAPKYGNDDDHADQIVRQLYDLFYEEFKKTTSVLGIPGDRPEPHGASAHNAFGYVTGALPSGRKAYISLTDASCSAMPGTDRNGPTALVNSAVKAMDTVRYGNNHLNMKFHPSALEGRGGATKLLSLIKTYMDLGGGHVQFNCVSTDTLRDAQVHPENYRDLVVRVAGFSAFFVHLDKGVQDEVIKRTELKFE